jgi:hypothetical protein
MYMSKFVRYQERTLISTQSDLWVIVVDTLITLENYVGHFIDEVIAKDTIDHPGQWFDNGEDCFTHTKLEHRVVEVYEESERERIKSYLHTTPTADELKSLPKFQFYSSDKKL